MFKDYVTPYDLALSSVNQECRNFALSLKALIMHNSSHMNEEKIDDKINSSTPSAHASNGKKLIFKLIK